MAAVQSTLDFERISVLRSTTPTRRRPDSYRAVSVLAPRREARPAVSLNAVMLGALVVILLLTTGAPDLLITPGIVGFVSYRLIRSRRGLRDVL